MKMWTYRLLAAMLVLSHSAHAQNTGDAAVETAKTASSNDWRNWTFVAVALVTAATAVYIISINDGQKATSN